MGQRCVDRKCPRCGGNILIDRDMYGWYEQCLQCAYCRDLVLLNPDIKNPAPAEFVLDEMPALSDVPINTYR